MLFSTLRWGPAGAELQSSVYGAALHFLVGTDAPNEFQVIRRLTYLISENKGVCK